MRSGFSEVEAAIREAIVPGKAELALRFFKAGPGEYGEGDKFLGVSTPDQRAIAKHFWKSQSEEDIVKGLHAEWHEIRSTYLFILTHHYRASKKNEQQREKWIQIYLNNLQGVNNWDLVDCSAPHLLGDWLLDKDRAILREFAHSNDLWKQRIAMVSNWWLIRHNQLEDTLEIAEILLFHEHDLIHKAVGWMLREMGKRDKNLLEQFLEHHARHMPRTALRYAIEKMDKGERQYWMRQKTEGQP